MIWTIIKRELLENIYSLRYSLTLILVLFLSTISGYVFISRFEKGLGEYHRETHKNLAGLEEQATNLSHVPNYVQTIHRHPKMLELACAGFEKSLPNTFRINAFSIFLPELKSAGNFLMSRFSDIDWTFMVAFVLSFISLLLTYESFSGERQRGTLSQIMCNPVSRESLLLGKYLGGMLTLMVPLLLGISLNLLIVSTSEFVSIQAREWTKILVIAVVSALYLSIFVLLGMLVSIRTDRASTSLVILLFVWVIVVIVIPSGGRILAEHFYEVPSQAEVHRRFSEARQEIWEHSERYGENAGNWGGDLNADWINPPARARLYDAITDARNQIFGEYIHQMIEQVRFGRAFTRVSPTTIYQSASESIVSVGIVRFGNLYQQLKQYKEALRKYVIEKDREDPDSWHLLFERHQRCLSQEPVDFNTIPRFQEKDPSLSETIPDSIIDLGMLMLYNILLFMAAYVAFLRSDVR